jgi:predicted transcriptional regulator
MDEIYARFLLDLRIERSPYSTFVTVTENDTVQSMLNKMAANKILSIPVSYSSQKWGLISLLDLAKVLLYRINDIEQFYSETIGKNFTFNLESPTLELQNDPKLTDLIKLLGIGHHRVLVTNGGDPVGLLSQMDVIRFILKNLHLIPEKLRLTAISSLTKHTQNVISVKETDKFVDALQVIVTHDFYGIGVVNKENKLVGNFSVSDLRGCSAEELKHCLNLSVHGFFNRTKSFLLKDLITCNSSDTFETALSNMVFRHVHRVYITNNDKVPISVFSASDAVNHILASTVSSATL